MQPDLHQNNERSVALDQAILRTLIYADSFNFPMTLPEIHHFLIERVATCDEIENRLKSSTWLATQITQRGEYYGLTSRSAHFDERERRTRASIVLLPIAIAYGRQLASLPFVRMVALTGSLAMHNAHSETDDIDYLIVTSAGRVWLTRAFSVLLVRLARLRGVHLCPNYVLSETALVQNRRDLYLAHEVTQAIPLAGLSAYQTFRDVNRWTFQLLPNAENPFHPVSAIHPQGIGKSLQSFGEWLLNGKLGNWLEKWEQQRKIRKFARKAQQKQSSAQLDAEHVKGHFNDYGYPTLTRYYEQLTAYGLSESTSGADLE